MRENELILFKIIRNILICVKKKIEGSLFLSK